VGNRNIFRSTIRCILVVPLRFVCRNSGFQYLPSGGLCDGSVVSARAGGPRAGRRGQRQRAGVVQHRGMIPPLHLRHHQGAVWAGRR
jgi:hypothetical protein